MPLVVTFVELCLRLPCFDNREKHAFEDRRLLNVLAWLFLYVTAARNQTRLYPIADMHM